VLLATIDMNPVRLRTTFTLFNMIWLHFTDSFFVAALLDQLR
jgi:hypothetical protein